MNNTEPSGVVMPISTVSGIQPPDDDTLGLLRAEVAAAVAAEKENNRIIYGKENTRR